jgi:DNA topoisomerase IA
MRTLDDRGYVEKEGRSLKPTDTGDVVSTFLEDNFPTYIATPLPPRWRTSSMR